MPILGIIASSKLGVVPGDFESIATVSVGSGGAANVEFTSIPATYTHLQIRAFYKTSGTGANLKMSFNSNAFSLVRSHYLFGDGSSVTAGTDTSTIASINDGEQANIFASQIFDILDYTSTNKNLTIRTLGGIDHNGSGVVYLLSALTTTAASISSIKFTLNTADNFSQYTQFALYGIRT